MARYDREFLVPYLFDICSLHLAHRLEEEKYNQCKWKIKRIEWESTIPEPTLEPCEEGKFYLNMMRFTGIMFALCIMAYVAGCVDYSNTSDYYKNDEGLMVSAILMMLVGIWFCMALGKYLLEKKENKEIDERNQEKILEFMASCQIAEDRAKTEIAKVDLELQSSGQEMERIQMLLDKAYSVNVIPNHYRNIHVAIYLYDWFSSGRADDLERALEMFVLEEIKDRLDKIISLQSETILNQRIMIANQYKSMQQQERHNAMLCAKLDQIAASNEERNIYLGMIEANTAANAYFSAASYFRK